MRGTNKEDFQRWLRRYFGETPFQVTDCCFPSRSRMPHHRHVDELQWNRTHRHHLPLYQPREGTYKAGPGLFEIFWKPYNRKYQKELADQIEFFGILQKVVTIKADNSANVKKAIKLLNLSYIGCFGHDLNLIAQELLKAVPSFEVLRSKVSHVVTFTRQSPQAKEHFELCQNQSKGTHLKLQQAVPTR